jgi:hypothetical protein
LCVGEPESVRASDDVESDDAGHGKYCIAWCVEHEIRVGLWTTKT